MSISQGGVLTHSPHFRALLLDVWMSHLLSFLHLAQVKTSLEDFHGSGALGQASASQRPWHLQVSFLMTYERRCQVKTLGQWIPWWQEGQLSRTGADL